MSPKHGQLIYQGKAKRIFQADLDDAVLIEFKNDATAFNGEKKSSFEEKMEARRKLDLLPKNSSPVRVRNRCQKTGRPRGYMRFFGLSRISMRDLALRGHLPGIRKGSL